MPRTFRRTTLLAALFGVFGLLLSWPLLGLGLETGLGFGATYVFGLWAAMVAALYLVSRLGRRPVEPTGPDHRVSGQPGEGR